MSFFLIYITKLSISLAVVFLFYHLVLRKLTFYNCNRVYLLAYSLFSFLIPFIDITGALQQNKLDDNSMVNWMPVFQLQTEAIGNNTGLMLSAWNTVAILILSGIVFMLLRLIIQLISFKRMMNKATLISGNGMNIYQINESIIPFSFGNSIFINRDLHHEKELEEIIKHELVHVKHKHSIDITCAEILCVLNWFNPFAWLIRKAIRQNLEFIADSQVLKQGVEKSQYQYLLLKVIGNNHFSIAPKFNFSSLKKRIVMMNKLKSAKANLVRFLFVLPLIAIILVSFRKQITDTLVPPDKNLQQQEQLSMADTTPVVKNYTDKGYYIEIYNNKVKDNPLIVIKDKNRKEVQRLTMDDWNSRKDYYDNLYGELPPPPPPAPPPPPPPVKLPENVKRININNDVTTVWLKNGEKEKYDMNIPAQKNEFEKKYGPPPPPPAAPAVPEMVPSGNGNNNSALGNSYEITDKKATINLKNEATEIYDLTNQTDRKKFEDKYGKINASGVSSTAPTPVAYASGTGGNTVIAPMNPMPGERPLVVNNNGYTITGMEAILITITKNSSRKQLDEYISQMKAKGIELIFDEIEYNNGVLVKITATMKSKDSRSNFVATDFSKLELAMIKDGDKTWFKVSTKDNKEII